MNGELSLSGEWLDLTAIAEMTQTAYGVLRRYAEQTEVQRAFGAERQAGAKGVRWPMSSLSEWRNLADRHRDGTITPRTVAAYLSKQTALVPLSNSGIAPIQQLGEDAVGFLARMVELLEMHNATLPPPDKLLSMRQAHDETGLSYAILRGLRFRVGNRLYVSRLDCLRAVQEAKEKK